jgi:hypothetical protein
MFDGLVRVEVVTLTDVVVRAHRLYFEIAASSVFRLPSYVAAIFVNCCRISFPWVLHSARTRALAFARL